jgi:GH15 family glucan-1,4-alpha-glucosidase
MEWLARNWQRADEGIWESRGSRRELLHSRLMCWVAFDRAVRLARKRALPAPLVDWMQTRDAIYHDIHTSFWDAQQGAFVQSRGSKALDASCLLMPLLRCISPTDPRWLSTLKAVGEQLRDDSLIYRYSGEAKADGLLGVEGTFNMCSFWYIECVARAGDVKQARFLFEKMLGYANHVGLFSEELGPAGEHLGNFPQAFTHLSLISAAHYLDRALSGLDGRS